MNYSQLKAFHHVALHCGFSRAANALKISQPAVSEQVRKLEQEYDVLLVSRERKLISLTEVGEKLFLLTKKFFEVEQQIQDYISETRVEIVGCIRIVADSVHHVTAILTEFRRRYPKVMVVLKAGNSEDVVEKLRAYDAEIGIVGSLAPGLDIETIELCTTEIIAFAAQGLVPTETRYMSLEDLAEFPLVFREQGSKTREKIEYEAMRQGINLVAAIEAEGREAMCEVVASGAGIGFISKAEFGDDPRLVQIVLEDVELVMSETVAFLGQRKDVRIIRAFTAVAEECLKLQSQIKV